MATVVSRRSLPPHHHRIALRIPRTSAEGSFFHGLVFALPLSLLVWFTLVWALRQAI